MTITTAHALAACSYLIDWQPGGKHMISDDDRDRLWDLLGIYHAHVVGHGSCQLAFAIGLDGVVKLETVQLWKHPEMTVTEARETYTKALDNVWAQLQVGQDQYPELWSEGQDDTGVVCSAFEFYDAAASCLILTARCAKAAVQPFEGECREDLWIHRRRERGVARVRGLRQRGESRGGPECLDRVGS